MGTRTIIPTLREESAPVPFAKLPTVEKELRTQTDNQRSTYDSDDVLIQVRPSRDDLAADYGADTVDFIAVASPDSIRRLVFTAADGPTERAGWRWYPDRLGERTIARVEHNDQLTPIGAVARVSDGGGD